MKKTKKLLAALSIAAAAVTVSAGCSKVLAKYDGKTVQGYVKKEYIGIFQ